jgi:hypothetical protein
MWYVRNEGITEASGELAERIVDQLLVGLGPAESVEPGRRSEAEPQI